MYIYIYIYYIYIYVYITIRGMALVISADFLHNFFINIFLTKHIINWPSFCIRPNFLPDQTKCVFKLVFSQLMGHKFHDLVLSSSRAMANKRKQRGWNNADNMLISMFDFL